MALVVGLLVVFPFIPQDIPAAAIPIILLLLFGPVK